MKARSFFSSGLIYRDDNVHISQENYNFAHGREGIIDIYKP